MRTRTIMSIQTQQQPRGRQRSAAQARRAGTAQPGAPLTSDGASLRHVQRNKIARLSHVVATAAFAQQARHVGRRGALTEGAQLVGRLAAVRVLLAPALAPVRTPLRSAHAVHCRLLPRRPVPRPNGRRGGVRGHTNEHAADERRGRSCGVRTGGRRRRPCSRRLVTADRRQRGMAEQTGSAAPTAMRRGVARMRGGGQWRRRGRSDGHCALVCVRRGGLGSLWRTDAGVHCAWAGEPDVVTRLNGRVHPLIRLARQCVGQLHLASPQALQHLLIDALDKCSVCA